MPRWLREHYSAAGKPDYIATVHRLDKVTGGVMVFSRRKEVTGKLTALVAQHRITKEYLAVLRGHPEKEEDTLTGLFLRTMAGKIAEASPEERPFLERAVRFGLAALEGREEPK